MLASSQHIISSAASASTGALLSSGAMAMLPKAIVASAAGRIPIVMASKSHHRKNPSTGIQSASYSTNNNMNRNYYWEHQNRRHFSSDTTSNSNTSSDNSKQTSSSHTGGSEASGTRQHSGSSDDSFGNRHEGPWDPRKTKFDFLEDKIHEFGRVAKERYGDPEYKFWKERLDAAKEEYRQAFPHFHRHQRHSNFGGGSGGGNGGRGGGGGYYWEDDDRYYNKQKKGGWRHKQYSIWWLLGVGYVSYHVGKSKGQSCGGCRHKTCPECGMKYNKNWHPSVSHTAMI